ncbi:hypothetical protein RHOM_12695 [Roseburia hominis A2-183]|uniref:Uncharacterized protein n=1 Tax=Roseburia hominis (strain DSM 16839 / JCM 17582 / NCIMB 14029 / A2-183) TaxID=585394 RepID=G2SY59_ROSHA|nr:hypothetical protein RHOM_12695 [Roseburia hominis A2-183]
MKCLDGNLFYTYYTSLPVRGAWIEIDVELAQTDAKYASLPVRGAWIEILIIETILSPIFVAPCEGSVD